MSAILGVAVKNRNYPTRSVSRMYVTSISDVAARRRGGPSQTPTQGGTASAPVIVERRRAWRRRPRSATATAQRPPVTEIVIGLAIVTMKPKNNANRFAAEPVEGRRVPRGWQTSVDRYRRNREQDCLGGAGHYPHPGLRGWYGSNQGRDSAKSRNLLSRTSTSAMRTTCGSRCGGSATRAVGFLPINGARVEKEMPCPIDQNHVSIVVGVMVKPFGRNVSVHGRAFEVSCRAPDCIPELSHVMGQAIKVPSDIRLIYD
jgi:hypothetical protein